MSNIRSLYSDLEHDIEFLKCLRRRNIDQKFHYIGSNSEKIYKTKGVLGNEDPYSTEEYVKNITPDLTKSTRVLLISLGCGKASVESRIVKKLQDDGYNVELLCVDSSKDMLLLAEETLSQQGIHDYSLMAADITSINFQQEIRNISKNYDKTIFCLFGGTIGNMIQTEIFDTLYNLLNKGDLLWLRILMSENKNATDRLRNFNGLKEWLNEPIMVDFFFNPLQNIGVPFANGQMSLSERYTDYDGVQRLRFGFKFEKETKVTYRNHKFIIMPNEEIKLMDIRIYHTPSLTSFLGAHGINLVSKYYKGTSRGQLLFRKEAN